MHKTHLVGARTHNLQRLSVDLAPGELVCVTGVSGAGKSSLALDTLYAEGQRRFVESFSPYARQFLERLERPPMDALEPVAAGVAVDRRAPVKSSRSTVATLADVEAYLSALFTREAVPVCPDCGVEARRTEAREAARALLEGAAPGQVLVVTFPARASGTADYLDLRARLLQDGFSRLLCGADVRELESLKPSEACDSTGLMRVVVDRVKVAPGVEGRVAQALEEAWARADGEAHARVGDAAVRRVRRGLVCPRCARSFEPARAGLFSYQSPTGACEACRGFGRTIGVDWGKVIPDPDKSLRQGALKCWNGKSSEWERRMLERYCAKQRIPFDAPWRTLTRAQQEAVLEGEGLYREGHYPGVRAWFRWMESRTYKMHVRVLLSRYRSYELCQACHGARLNPTALSYRVGGLDLAAWHGLELSDARSRLDALKCATGQGELARKELATRLGYLERVGLGYLTLDRPARTLSGGEAQRVSLTAALGTSLTGALFVLDEPTVGLHPSDVPPLTRAMAELAERGNIALVIEHDPHVIRSAQRVLELGPGAGKAGGQLCFDGTPAALTARQDLPTGRLLAGFRTPGRAPRQASGHLSVKNARAHNLRGLSVDVPLGVLCAITGPSGSGKSTLMDEVLYRHVARALGEGDVDAPGAADAVTGHGGLKSVELVDQSPLGRTSRGNAATYVKAWDRLRERFAAEPDAEVRGLTAAHFSFNVDKGRCEACSGEGYETVEMQFLADVALGCAACGGKRFKDEVLQVRHRGLSVDEVLALTVDEALERFGDDRQLEKLLAPVQRLGLGYLPLGQPLSTLSGGEAQRLKLARALSAPAKGALFLIDEPSAGLHDEDVRRVLEALHGLVDAGASVIVVDHDLVIMRGADWLVDLGPGGGRHGGTLVAEGTPEEVARRGEGLTARALRDELEAPRVREPARREDGAHAAAIEVQRAREHNLHDVSTDIPLGKLTVVTGPSGSGKSTLAFDVVFAEGQRRFLETLTPYARQFLPTMPRPDVERISGIPPAVALEQRTSRAGATSTVATVTEVAHYLRLLFAKLGTPHCPRCDAPISALAPDVLFTQLTNTKGEGTVLAPAVRARKGTYLDLFAAAARAGFPRAIVDGQQAQTDDPPRLAKTREHDIDIVMYEGKLAKLPREVFMRALAWGKGALELERGGEQTLLSTERTCPRCRLAVPELDPRWFSFNTRQGACEACEGTGLEGGVGPLDEGEHGPCRGCGGTRLAPIPRGVRLEGARYPEVVQASVTQALERVKGWRFKGDRALLGEPSRQELLRRLDFLARVGLGYLSLDRAAATLSGGEMQRLRLSAQLGAGLTGALYVLDEPTIGLHPRDTHRLLDNLRALVDTGSSVLVVEHDADVVRAADHLIDLGPTGGKGGGHIIAEGPPAEVLAHHASPTAEAFRAPLALPAPRAPAERFISLEGARAHNLQRVDLKVPVGRLTVVSGVSGSGKSTLVRQVLYPALREALGLVGPRPGAFDKLTGVDAVRRVLAVDQSPIGRTPRSVPATFLGLWDELRRAFAATPEAQVRGFTATRFSFNSAQGGRCPVCEGQGAISHEMSFLPDVVTPCEACNGLRFDPATLEVRYHGLSVGDVLRLSIDEAKDVFRALPKVAAPLEVLSELGVGYLQLGQGSNTLSGGEAQRLKLAAELTATSRHEPTLYVLDEPTTGLHLGDVARLTTFLHRLVERGDTLVVIEHHPNVIAAADHVVELGPEGGEGGGRIVAQGTPAQLARAKTPTGKVLKALLDEARRAGSLQKSA